MHLRHANLGGIQSCHDDYDCNNDCVPMGALGLVSMASNNEVLSASHLSPLPLERLQHECYGGADMDSNNDCVPLGAFGAASLSSYFEVLPAPQLSLLQLEQLQHAPHTLRSWSRTLCFSEIRGGRDHLVTHPLFLGNKRGA